MIKAIDAAQGGPPPEPSGVVDPEQRRRAEHAASGELVEPAVTPADIPLLTQEEKRRILARIARVNPLDCFDESGAFDIVRAKRILPPGMLRHIAVHEITRLNAEGQPVTERRINVRLVDPVSAIRLDDQMERRPERAASGSSSPSESPSDPDSPPPHPASPEYAHNLLRKNTIALDEANHTLALLKKALAEKHDRQRQLNNELEEKDHQLKIASKTLSEVEGQTPLKESSKTLSPGSMTLQSREQSREAGFATPLSGKPKALGLSNGQPPKSEGDTGCQPVNPRHPAPGKPLNELPNHELSDHRGAPRPPPKAL